MVRWPLLRSGIAAARRGEPQAQAARGEFDAGLGYLAGGPRKKILPPTRAGVERHRLLLDWCAASVWTESASWYSHPHGRVPRFSGGCGSWPKLWLRCNPIAWAEPAGLHL